MFDFRYRNFLGPRQTADLVHALGLAIFIECVVVGVCLLVMYAVIAMLMIFMERKVCAAFQCRLGPVRVGPWGNAAVVCDIFKMLTKEIITIRHADKFLYNLAPYMVILASVLAFSCLPINRAWRCSTSTSASSS